MVDDARIKSNQAVKSFLPCLLSPPSIFTCMAVLCVVGVSFTCSSSSPPSNPNPKPNPSLMQHVWRWRTPVLTTSCNTRERPRSYLKLLGWRQRSTSSERSLQIHVVAAVEVVVVSETGSSSSSSSKSSASSSSTTTEYEGSCKQQW